MPFNPNIPPDLFLDENLRAVPLGQPGLQDLDHPIYDFVTNGEDSKQIQTQITDEVIKALTQRDSAVRSSILEKMYFYPQSLGNITSKSYSEGFEVPRHALKVTILDYAGGNLISKEGKKKLEAAFNTYTSDNTGFWDKINAASDAVNEVLTNNPALYASEINNYQDRANQLNRGGLNKMLNDMSKEATLKQQQDHYKNATKEFLEGIRGKDFATQYLTSANRADLVKQSLTNQIASTTVMQTQMLPDEIKSIIYLYANGENLNYSYSTSWNAKDQSGMFANLQNIAAELTESGVNSGSVMEAVKKATAALGAEVLREGQTTYGKNPIATALMAKVGMVPAQNYEYLFDSVGRRNFSVNVLFYPKSETEMRSAAQIISAFKYYSHPSRPERSAIMKVPCVFMLENMSYVDGKGWCENLYLPKYKICALLNTNVNYSQNGQLITHQQMADIKNGAMTFKAPIKISLALNFQEMHVLTREDIPNPKNFFDASVETNGYY